MKLTRIIIEDGTEKYAEFSQDLTKKEEWYPEMYVAALYYLKTGLDYTELSPTEQRKLMEEYNEHFDK